MLRQDGDRKAQQLKQAEKDRRIMNKQHQEVQQRLEQANARLVQLMEANTNFKRSDSGEKARLRLQNEKLQSLCRTLRDEVKDLKAEAAPRSPSAASVDSASSPVPSDTSVDGLPITAAASMEPNGGQNGKDEIISSSASANLSDAMSQALTISAEASSTSVDNTSLTQ